jgi:molecular chaperone DnaJ
MKGKGIPHLHGTGAGDQLVRIQVWTPTKLSKTSRELFQKLVEHKDVFPEAEKWK